MVLGMAVASFVTSSAMAQEFRIEYTGELIDESARPLSGVFPMTFKLYENADSTEPIWSESHYVAVVDGEYTLDLGNATPLDPELARRALSLGAELLGQEIVREPMIIGPSADVAEAPELPIDLSEGDITTATFVNIAQRVLYAPEARRARIGYRLNGRTLEDIDRSEEVLQHLEQHEVAPDAHSETQGNRLGATTTVLERVGGRGGHPYTRLCPEGSVAVGIQGASGAMVDSVELVCAPLE